MSSLKPVFVGVESPSYVSANINNYDQLIEISEDLLEELAGIREEYDIAKVHFLDQLMDFLQEFKEFKKELPVVKIKTVDRDKLKKQLRTKVKARKQQLESAKKEMERPAEVNTRLEELDKIKSFRKDLERINSQLSGIA